MPNSNNELCSIQNFFESLRYYNIIKTNLLSKLIMNFGLDKLLNVGRILIINYVPLGLFGQLAVLLEVYLFLKCKNKFLI